MEEQLPKDLDEKEEAKFFSEKKNIFINSMDKFKNTPLLCACFKLKEQNEGERRVDLIKFLVQNEVLFAYIG